MLTSYNKSIAHKMEKDANKKRRGKCPAFESFTHHAFKSPNSPFHPVTPPKPPLNLRGGEGELRGYRKLI
jgi:hypothetical protein